MAIDAALLDYILLLQARGGQALAALSEDQIATALLDTSTREYAWVWKHGVRQASYELTRYDEYTFQARHRFWLPTPTFQDTDQQSLTPDSSSLREGVWDFTTDAPARVLLTGRRVNLVDAAIAALTAAYHANVGLVDVNDPAGAIQLSQQVAQIRQALLNEREQRGPYRR